jgi:hypothetical protein
MWKYFHIALPITLRKTWVSLLLGLLMRKIFTIIGHIWVLYFKGFSIMAIGRRRPEERFR